MADIFELCKTGTAAVVETAINNGADVNTRNENGDTPLTLAAELNTDYEVLEVLLKAGADTEARDTGNDTPLHLSARFNHNPDVIEALVKAGARVQAKNENGDMPIDLLEKNDNFSKIKGTDVYRDLCSGYRWA